jgi:hypothetical protein
MVNATLLPKLAGACAALIAAAAAGTALRPPSSLHIMSGGMLVEWWRSDRAPARWTGPLPVVADAFHWQPLRPGIDIAQADIAVNRGWLRLRVIAVRLEPGTLQLGLEQHTAANGMTGTWTARRAPEDVVFGINAGQFSETGPWGWLVLDGRETRYPGRGPLSMGVALDTAGTVHWMPDSTLLHRRRSLAPRWAFQSYPVLLDAAGTVPPLLGDGRLMDTAHRDTRLAIGRLADGRLLVILTRFAAGGRFLERLPAGLTTAETAALMGALGARPALMLDGGLSAQMLVRDSAGVAGIWPGARRVPLALTARRDGEGRRPR